MGLVVYDGKKALSTISDSIEDISQNAEAEAAMIQQRLKQLYYSLIDGRLLERLGGEATFEYNQIFPTDLELERRSLTIRDQMNKNRFYYGCQQRYSDFWGKKHYPDWLRKTVKREKGLLDRITITTRPSLGDEEFYHISITSLGPLNVLGRYCSRFREDPSYTQFYPWIRFSGFQHENQKLIEFMSDLDYPDGRLVKKDLKTIEINILMHLESIFKKKMDALLREF